MNAVNKIHIYANKRIYSMIAIRSREIKPPVVIIVHVNATIQQQRQRSAIMKKHPPKQKPEVYIAHYGGTLYEGSIPAFSASGLLLRRNRPVL